MGGKMGRGIFDGCSALVFCGAGFSVFWAILVRVLVGSPRQMLHLFCVGDGWPPLWVLGVFWFGGFVVMGGAAGCLLSCPTHGPVAAAASWRGGTFLSLSLSISLMWYTLAFGRGALLLSFLCLALSLAAGVCVCVSWWEVSRAGGLIAGGYCLWLAVLLFVQLGVMLGS